MPLFEHRHYKALAAAISNASDCGDTAPIMEALAHMLRADNPRFDASTNAATPPRASSPRNMSSPIQQEITMVNNSDRADFAAKAVAAFIKACPTDYDDAIGDLICDLLHLARRTHPKWVSSRIVLNAVSNFYEEEAEEKATVDDGSDCEPLTKKGENKC